MAIGQELSIEEKDELLKACNKGDLKLVKSLVEKGGPNLIKDSYAGQALLHATEQEHLDIIKFLVEKGVDVNDTCFDSYYQEEEFQNTVLMIAAEKGNLEITKYLIENGADVNGTGYEDQTPLHCAATYGKLDIIKFLVEKGADIEFQDGYGQTPASTAAANGNTEIVKFLLDKLPKKSRNKDDIMLDAFYYAALYEHTDTLKYLEEKEINLNKEHSEKEIPMLHEAIERKDINVIKCLIDKGANINIKNRSQNTPLHIAIEKGNKEIVKLLLEKGADINAQGEYMLSPLHLAIHKESPELVRLLVAQGANLNIKPNGKTPLEYAHDCVYLYGKPQVESIVHYLLRFEKNIDKYQKNYPKAVKEEAQKRKVKKAIEKEESIII